MMESGLLYPAFFAVAFLYASVGHGGASGFLAVLTLCGFALAPMQAGALFLNLMIAAVSFWAFRRARHFEWRLFWPFAATSIPCSFLGGLLALPPRAYGLLLAATLLSAALRLGWNVGAAPAGGVPVPAALPSPLVPLPKGEGGKAEARAGGVPVRAALPSPLVPLPKGEGGEAGAPAAWAGPRLPVALGAGAGIGLLSGMVGVGGGIFLSPLMILMRWADAKKVAAVSALFIWVNSLAGLLGHFVRGGAFPAWPWSLAGAACAGALAGAHLGAGRFDSRTLRRLLSVVLLMASWKLLRAAL